MQIGAKQISVTGSLIKIARLDAELYEDLSDPFGFCSELKSAGRRVADLFTFIQKLPDTKPKFPDLFMEWDNLAVVPVTTYENWWTKQVNDKTRNMVRQMQKKGGEIRIVPFNDSLVEGISQIYNESPIRQGRRFWHFGKSLEAVRSENGTFLDRSVFIGAFFKGQLIGFLKLIFEPGFTSVMQILSLIGHRDKAPTNALVAKAVEITAERGIPYCVYAKYIYGRKGEDSLARFKKHNGFVKIDLPRYYMPLTWRGKAALRLGLHQGLQDRLPQGLVLWFLNRRAKWFERRVRRKKT